jgi:hypothetical protein
LIIAASKAVDILMFSISTSRAIPVDDWCISIS